MSKDIRTLICETAEGDMNALAELYNMLSHRILNYAKTITKNKEMAEDITHDVFLQINRQAAQIAQTSDPAAYIMVITRNHSYNLLKRNSRTPGSLDDALELPDDLSPYDNLLFEDAFSGLPANQRETVYLHLICGFTFKDIAGMQRTPLVTVKWRYSKALSQLRTYFTHDKQDKKEENCNGNI